MKILDLKTKYRIYAAAKINLMLDILDKRADGYHEICSIMQKISYFDTLDITFTENDITVSGSDSLLPRNEKNICYKAAKAYFERSGIKGGVNIYIYKNIPTCAGLGGGSSDAAATLLALEKKFGALKTDLLPLATEIGADVPFCMSERTALCEGIGEKITPIKTKDPSSFYVTVAKGSRGLSTAEIYNKFDLLPSPVRQNDADSLIRALEDGDVKATAELLSNMFMPISAREIPEIAALQKQFISLGALGSVMSGSGPSVFGIFSDMHSAVFASETLKKEGYTSFFATFL